MERPRLLRYVRIAVTALSLAACVLLVALWVRSYHVRDFYQWHWQNRDYSAFSNAGEVTLHRSVVFSVPFSTHGGSLPVMPDGVFSSSPESPLHRMLGLSWSVHNRDVFVGAHFGWIVLFGIGMTAAPWLHWRFSLRTLLIAITLVALGLGLVVTSS
jgi:hypothetical protein